MHLVVLPDFLERKDSKLTVAATKPIEFKASVVHEFQLGKTKPEIDVTPSAQTMIRINATPGSELIEGDTFHDSAKVPDHTGYVSVGFQGSLDLGVSGSDGDLSFGFDATSTVNVEYFKAFPLGLNEPTLAVALGQTMSGYVIPADLFDFSSLNINDIATVSGQGSLKISGGVKVSAIPNPLVSVGLPLGAGSIAVKAGPVAGLSASFTLSGSYQVRARRLDADTIELSFLREHGTAWKADLAGSAGISVSVGTTDLVGLLMEAISVDPSKDKKQLRSLRPEEVEDLTAAIKSGLDHSLRASMDLVLSSSTENDVAFQYHVEPGELGPDANTAVHHALGGDLSLLTALEDTMQDGGVLAPGLQMRNSMLTELHKRETSLKVNLLGIVNLVTVSDLILKGETLTDEVTGDVTIKETITGNQISALTDPLDRHEALRKAMFDSVLATTCYRAGKVIALPALSCRQVHFALNRKTNPQIVGDYLNWFAALRLLTPEERTDSLAQFRSDGTSTCVLRTSFGDNDCTAMFFDGSDNLYPEPHYLEIGRQAMRALLDPDHQDADKLRYQILDDALWPTALGIGANVHLGPLVGLGTEDPQVVLLIGDVEMIKSWADAMSQVGAVIQDVRTFVGDSDPYQFP